MLTKIDNYEKDILELNEELTGMRLKIKTMEAQKLEDQLSMQEKRNEILELRNFIEENIGTGASETDIREIKENYEQSVEGLKEEIDALQKENSKYFNKEKEHLETLRDLEDARERVKELEKERSMWIDSYYNGDKTGMDNLKDKTVKLLKEQLSKEKLKNGNLAAKVEILESQVRKAEAKNRKNQLSLLKDNENSDFGRMYGLKRSSTETDIHSPFTGACLGERSPNKLYRDQSPLKRSFSLLPRDRAKIEELENELKLFKEKLRKTRIQKNTEIRILASIMQEQYFQRSAPPV